MEALPLYSLLPFFLFHPSLPLVDYVDPLLDACPIRTLQEVLDVAVRLNISVLSHFHINAIRRVVAEHLM